ncbi:ankyrin repeat family A protein 2-like isoform X2 [Ptychodera flava]|uniref:ankyrin repeat family A protein 2-like isoform X2 n=1 Tax=Ptychodera flava TaxID=63121 RepID=UPI00396A2D76
MAESTYSTDQSESAFHNVESTSNSETRPKDLPSTTTSSHGGSLTNLSAIAIGESLGVVKHSQPSGNVAATTSQSNATTSTTSMQQPNVAMCSSLLKSLNEDGYHGDGEGDSVSPDLEVASVLFPDGRLKSPTPTLKRVSSSTSSSSKSSYSPMKQPTTYTNKQRRNIQTATPSLLQELTPHQLAAQGELTFLSEKIQSGVSVNVRDENGHTPLMWACGQNQTTIVEYLLEKGADASNQSLEGETALAFACSHGSVQIVKLLLAAGVDVNTYDMNGGTPILYAVYSNHPQCVRLLLEYGADLTMETESGHTALGIAMAMGHQTVQHTIEEHLMSLLEGDVS